MSLLVPCSGKANCYIYTVRGPGRAETDPGGGHSRGHRPQFFGGKPLSKIYAMTPGRLLASTPARSWRFRRRRA